MDIKQNESELITFTNHNSKRLTKIIITVLFILTLIAITFSIVTFMQIRENIEKQETYQTLLSLMKSEIDSLNSKQNKLEWDLFFEKLKNKKGFVDLTSSSIQEIGDGFMVVGLDVKEHLTGIKVYGRMINYTALKHQNIKFKIEVNEQEKDIYINQISSGNSTRFVTYIPNVPVEKTNYATIKYQESTVSYYTR